MPQLINVGVSALLANQANLATTGHNISNANTEGYSRQQTITSSTLPQKNGNGFIGSGVTVDGVRRIVNEFATVELRTTSENYNRINTVLQQSQQLDNILGEDATGLSPVLQEYFGALQTAADDPSSVSSRQVVLTSAELLVNRVNELGSRLDSQNASINSNLETLAGQVTMLASSIADLNGQITTYATSSAAQLPNDLLDERDRALQDLSELMNAQIYENDDKSVSVFVGNGQALVMGARSFEISAEPGTDDPSRYDLVYTNSSIRQTITDGVTGGEMGGLLEFRNEILDPAYGQLGIVALGLTEAVNEQHALGMDLDGELGGDFFRDINDETWALSRVTGDDTNAFPGTEVIRADILDVSSMTTSDYELRFSEAGTTSYTVVRLSDGEEVAKKSFSGIFPSTVEFDGVEVTIEAGEFGAGDTFLITPARNGAREMDLNVSNVRDLAFAQPVRVESNEANRGTGEIGQGTVVDTSTTLFSQINDTGDLNPPLVIQFTSGSTYNILDNSDPANPVDLEPPLRNLTYVPNMNNDLLPEDLNQQTVLSQGTSIGIAQSNAVAGVFDNGYTSENIVVTRVDPETNEISRQTITTNANDSAAEIAAQLNDLNHVTATASTYAVLDEINSSSPMTFTLNGENFTVGSPDNLAVSISQNANLAAMGISASSNGSQVTLTSTTGVDFEMQVTGGAGDNLSIAGENGSAITVSGADPIPQVTIGGTLAVVLDEGGTLTGSSDIFETLPQHYDTFLGMQITMSGAPAEGDVFEVNYNKDGDSDNRNILALGALQTEKVMFNGEATIRDAYSNLVNYIGTKTAEADVGSEAAKTLMDRAQDERDSISGVNLDEEAGNVIKYEQAYNASAQLIAVARSIFDTLLQSVG
ncbi:MAG TPA: flagellar hook-associated protein FlgK [Gammaproteobacteria bacterium]|nr:flagellar hook-associated protein FlgK [Gammaproteobacteria bacterium]HCK94501.1 flagellar hook-associated protein FlgK [Gammaproteobacteria bacterium]|tara:strand:- start:275 stop:2905 length:2631 start_codon:yes stop_codon:yes gene_type:complete